MTEVSPPTAEESLTTSEAAAQLGISERTLRERIKAGKVRAEKVIDRGNAVYRVYLKGSPPPTDLPPPSTPEDSPPVTKGSPPAAGGLGELVQLLRRERLGSRSLLEREGTAGFVLRVVWEEDDYPAANSPDAGAERPLRRPWWEGP